MKKLLSGFLCLCLMLSLCALAGAEAADGAAFRWRDRDMTVRYAEFYAYEEDDEEYGKVQCVHVYVVSVNEADPPRIDDLAAAAEGDFQVLDAAGNAATWKGFSGLIIHISANSMSYAETQPSFAFSFDVSPDATLDDLTLVCPGGERIPLSAVPHQEPEE